MKSRLVLAVAIVATVAISQVSYAIPPFLKVFTDTYGSNADLKKGIEEQKCNVCHEGKSKKDKNAYGKALHEAGLEKALGEKFKSDEAGATKTVAEALKKAEDAKNAAGKTFGELLKAGKLPGA